MCVSRLYSGLYIGMPCAEVGDRILPQQYRISPHINIGVLCKSDLLPLARLYSPILCVRSPLLKSRRNRVGYRADPAKFYQKGDVRVWESVFSTQSKNILAFIGFLSPHALWRTGYIYTYTSLEFRTEVVKSSYPIKRRKREREKKRTKYNKASIFMHDYSRDQ